MKVTDEGDEDAARLVVHHQGRPLRKTTGAGEEWRKLACYHQPCVHQIVETLSSSHVPICGV